MAQQPLWGMELQEKKVQKDETADEICFEKTYSYKVFVNSRLKSIYIVGQRKAFYRQIISKTCNI